MNNWFFFNPIDKKKDLIKMIASQTNHEEKRICSLSRKEKKRAEAKLAS